MNSFRQYINRSIVATLIVLALVSCATYNQQVQSYYGHLQQGSYEKAAADLDRNKLLRKDRNRLLYLLERGKICHLLNQWDSSNAYFNEADLMMETSRSSVKDIALGNLLNPMMQSYKAEDFEKYLVHYYKALNYIQLNEGDEAMVEARRITLRSNAQEDKNGNKDRYTEDAFALTMQGLVYENNNDLNNAFIAYRNAVDVYLKNNGSYYGTAMPQQLKLDLLRTADMNGFVDELNRYESLLGITYQTDSVTPAGGELVLFWENGSAPVKTQQDVWFSMFKDAGGGLFFTDPSGLYNVPFDYASSGYSRDNIKLDDLRSFRVALPKYEARPPRFGAASLMTGGLTYHLEPAENVSELAFATLKERTLKELTSTLARLAVKKLAEAAIRPKEAKENDKEKTEEQRKKEDKQRNQREALALGLQLFNFASEKADTRNWQSLPHSIYYTRIPLQAGMNELTLQLNGAQAPAIKIAVNGMGKMQFRSVSTIR